jgi:hypothetical protein
MGYLVMGFIDGTFFKDIPLQEHPDIARRLAIAMVFWPLKCNQTFPDPKTAKSPRGYLFSEDRGQG